MARPLRLEYPGALYHVTSRSDRRASIYLDDDDRRQFLKVLAGVIGRFNWRLHAYCLMTNHYHLVVETPDANLSRGMRQLNGVYTQRFNRTHQRVGHVFQGRFKAILVQKDAYLLELVRYVVLNPIRARMHRQPRAYRWSSYRATAGLAAAPGWLETAWLLSQFARTQAVARRRYVDFVRDGIGAVSPWAELKQQIYLGNDAFVARQQRWLPADQDLGEIPRAQRRAPPKPLSIYARRHRDARTAMVAAYRSGHYTLAAIARHFDVHYSTVSRAVRAAEEG